MDHDERGTHVHLHALRVGLVEPALALHGGQIIRSTGDGLLVHFTSATEALRCAVVIQRAIAARNVDVAPAEQIRFRMGLNVADILFDGDQDIAGGGVNLAARLETLAEPGGICISRALRDHIQEDLRVTYLDLGRKRVKNIRNPVRVYRVLTSPLPPLARVRVRLGAWWRGVQRGIALVSSAAAVAATAFALSGPQVSSKAGPRDGVEHATVGTRAVELPRLDLATWGLGNASARDPSRAAPAGQCRPRPLS